MFKASTASGRCRRRSSDSGQQHRQRQEDAPGRSRGWTSRISATAAAIEHERQHPVSVPAKREPPHATSVGDFSGSATSAVRASRLVLAGDAALAAALLASVESDQGGADAQMECSRGGRGDPRRVRRQRRRSRTSSRSRETSTRSSCRPRSRAAGRRCGSRTPARSRTSSRSRSSTATGRVPTCSRCSPIRRRRSRARPSWVTIRAGIPTLQAGETASLTQQLEPGPLRADLLPRRPERQAALPRRDAQRRRRRRGRGRRGAGGGCDAGAREGPAGAGARGRRADARADGTTPTSRTRSSSSRTSRARPTRISSPGRKAG